MKHNNSQTAISALSIQEHDTLISPVGSNEHLSLIEGEESMDLTLIEDIDKPASPLKPMRIGQLAQITQKTTRTLRLYEEQGLLQPLGRTDGGFRLYAPENIHRIHYIQKLQQLGYSLNQIHELLSHWKSYANSSEGMKAIQAVYERQLEKVQAQIQSLKELEQELEQSISFLKDCHPCQQAQTQESGCRHCDRPDVGLSELIIGLAKG